MEQSSRSDGWEVLTIYDEAKALRAERDVLLGKLQRVVEAFDYLDDRVDWAGFLATRGMQELLDAIADLRPEEEGDG